MHTHWLRSPDIIFLVLEYSYSYIHHYVFPKNNRSKVLHAPQKCSLACSVNCQESLSEPLCPLGPAAPSPPHGKAASDSRHQLPLITHVHHHAPGSPWPALVLGQGITPSLFKEGEMCLCLKSMHSARRSTSYLSYYL